MPEASQDTIWERRLDRERRARKAAEAILEQKSLELYEANQKLKQARDDLEIRVMERTRELGLSNEELRREAEERSKAEKELFRARSQLMDAIESLDGGLVIFGPDERLVVCNTHFKEMYHQADSVLIPGTTKEAFLKEFCARGGHVDSGLTAEEWGNQRLYSHRNPGSESVHKVGNRWIRVSDRRTSDGGVVSLSTDITDFKEVREAAEAANLAKSQFLANMSHEFRTPIAAVVGYAEMLLDPLISIEDRMRVVHSMTRNGRHLLALISDVLDLAKIEAGKLDMEKVPSPLWRIISETMSVAGVIAHEKKLQISVKLVGKIPRTITVDPTRFRQILDNLLTNAIKFTESGKKVELRVQIEKNTDPEGKESPLLRIDVDDQGIGMSSDVLSRIFKPFTQADVTTTRRFGGTGLGLSICKRFAESMGGDIQARSQTGVGSCFTLKLPIEAEHMNDLVTEEDLNGTARTKGKGWIEYEGKLKGKILLAEDNPDNRNIVRFFLERAGLTVEVAENGRVGVEKALANGFDLVLMDMQMPELDGYSATSILRQKGYGKPIIALTAHAMAEDEEKCLQAGCSGYLTKPVDPEKLLRLIKSQLVPMRLNQAAEREHLTLAHGQVDSGDFSLDELILAFRKALPAKIREFNEVFQKGDISFLASLSHQLRGSAGMYGLGDVSFLAGLIEDACRQEKQNETIRLLIGQLEILVSKIAR